MLQQQIAHVVTEGVVEGFEVVQIDQEHRAGLPLLLARDQDLLQLVLQEASVGQACEGVEERQLLDARLGSLVLGDI